MATTEKKIRTELETCLEKKRLINRSIENHFGAQNYSALEGLTLDQLYEAKNKNATEMAELAKLIAESSPFNQVAPKTADKIEPGAILYTNWGVEQTNVEFYCVVKTSCEYATLLPMTRKTYYKNYDKYMSTEERPLAIDLLAEPIRRKINRYGSSESVSVNSFISAWLWDGKTKTATHYA